ncbi:hypothetical protein [Luteococcus japonicus]|uniref:hypothetical protein n=1 Tax=Luteococcus japonicus TaxID=33984 RepID=UPI000F4A425D|nr:hypothetical protein [Luteococcus japonicus]
MQLITAIAKPSVSSPACQASKRSGRASCSICWLTMSMPMVMLTAKLDSSAPVIMKTNRPTMSKRVVAVCSALLSEVPQIITKDSADAMIEVQKM